MKSQMVKMTCDLCGKELTYNPDQWLVGGAYAGGWLHLGRRSTGTALIGISFQNAEGEKDFCSYKCLAAYAKEKEG